MQWAIGIGLLEGSIKFMKKKNALLFPILALAAVLLCFAYTCGIKSPARPVSLPAEETSSGRNPQHEAEKAAASPSQASAPAPVKPEDEKSANSLRIVATGDIFMGRGTEFWLKKQGKTFIYPFEDIAALLKKGDIIFGNLEAPLTASAKSLADIDKPGGKYALKNPPEALKGIKYAGFNLLNLANNHMLDYYDTGLYDTLDALEKNGIAHAGAGKDIDEARKPAIIEKNGLKIGLLSYTDMAEVVYKGNPPLSFAAEKNKAGVAPRNAAYIKEDIDKLRNRVDILLVSLHWGIEYCADLAPGQTEFAHSLIDQGADAVIGHHPHHIKGVEVYKGKPIIYSLGNFISDQADPANQEGFFIDMTYAGKNLKTMEAIPIKILMKSRIVPLSGDEATALLAKIYKISTNLGTKCQIKDGKVAFDIK